jgi:hypothetical protein
VRDGKQLRLRREVFLDLCRRLKVPPESLIPRDSPVTGGEFRVDVTARALATEFWASAKQDGAPPAWLIGVLRSVLHFDTWSGALWEGGTPVLNVSDGPGRRTRRRAVKRIEARRRSFCDLMAQVMRMLLPTEADQKHGVSVNRRRSGALAGAFRDGGIRRLVRVGDRSSAMSRAAATEVVATTLRDHFASTQATDQPKLKRRAMIRST